MLPMRACRKRFEWLVVLAVMSCPVLVAQVGAKGNEKSAACVIARNGVRIPCPEGWNVVDEYHDPYTDEIIIGNFPRTTENHNKGSGPGMATVAVSGLPKGYEGLDRWIWVGRKNAPDAIETSLEVTNQNVGKVTVVCMTSPANSGPTFASYFFQIGKVPLLLELSYRAQDPNKDQYRYAVQRMIERATVAR
jgi:hypothetical protein